MTVPPRRRWPLPHAHNIRDLGGYNTDQGAVIRWSRLLRADDLWHLTEDSRAALCAAGLVQVIDLRGPHETGTRPSPFATADAPVYRNIAIFDQLSPLARYEGVVDMGARYCAALDHCAAPIAEVLRAIARAPEGLVLFHCTAGKDRTGLIAALVLRLCDVREDEVIADYVLTAHLGAPMLAQLHAGGLAQGMDPAQLQRILSAEATLMTRTLAHLRDVHGGARAWATAAGLQAADLDSLRRGLLHLPAPTFPSHSEMSP